MEGRRLCGQCRHLYSCIPQGLLLQSSHKTRYVYIYTVKAYNNKTQEWSGFEKPGVKASTIPTKASFTSIKQDSNGRITFNWNKSLGANCYIIRYKTTSSGWSVLKKIKDGNTLTYTYNYPVNLPTGKVYFSIRAYNAISGGRTGKADYDTPGTAITLKPVYVAGSGSSDTVTPIKSVSISNAFHSLDIKWSQSPGASGYIIQTATNANFSQNVKILNIKGGNILKKRVPGLKNGVKYYVRLRAYKVGSGVTYYSTWSPVKSYTVKPVSDIDYLNWAISIANNNNIGYGHYWGSNPTKPISISCAGLVGMALHLYGYGDFLNTGDLDVCYNWHYIDNTYPDSIELYKARLREAGFVSYSYSSVKNSLQPGDILYCVPHIGFYIGNGKTVEARGSGSMHYDQFGSYTGPTYADDDGAEVAIYSNNYQGWTHVYRMP